jgi:exosortase/archaeosortase family protein
MVGPAVRFALLFFGGLLTFSVVAAAWGLQNRLGPVERALTSAAAQLARWSGANLQVVDGNLIVLPHASLLVNHECTGVFVIVVLACFVLAYPASWRSKALGLFFGVVLLSAVNVIRIATLARLAEFYPALLEYAHEYVWQGAFLLLVTLYAMSWVEWSRT